MIQFVGRDAYKQFWNFSKDEKKLIIKAISNHRSAESTDDLSKIIYKADKISRPCFNCYSKKDCKRFKNNEKATLYY